MWEFNKEVAGRFQQEAAHNIPDYDRVIQLCIQVADAKFKPDSIFVDVGSALGETLYQFKANGYPNIVGVESSEAMRDQSMFSKDIILSDTYPNITAEMVMANWTLHFVKERHAYIHAVYESLVDGGVFILTDKTTQCETVKQLYYDFKRDNGVSDTYIREKEEKLRGYMNLYPVSWYLNCLTDVGFKNVEILNAKYGFVTFYAER
jgi:hypothetical protein